MKRTLVLILLCVLAATGWRSARAGTDDARAAFAQGRDAFSAGDYARALERFRAAAAAGLDSAALHYNLGATLYRLGRYDDARAQFERLLGEARFATLARYNLGLIALKQGRSEQAREYFAAVRQSAENPKLRRLAARGLDRVRRDDDPVGGLISFAAGYDDNASFAPEADLVGVSRQGDAFAEVLAAARKALPGQAGLRVEGGVYARDYQKVDRFDQVSLRGGLARVDTWDGWRTTLNGNAAVVYLGGDPLEWIATAGAEGRRRFGAQRLRLRYRLSRIEGASGYAHLSGWRHRARADLRLPTETGWVELGYRLEVNDRKDLEAGAAFFSQSPIRNAVYAEWLWQFDPATDLTLTGEWGRSRYRDPDVRVSGLRTVSRTRQDDRLELSLRASRIVADRWQMFGRYSYTDNGSNFDTYRYQRNEVTLGIERDF